MKLADFLLSDMDGIVTEWEHFAATLLPAARDMSALELRDHAREILRAIAVDLRNPQTPFEQSEKSKGRAPVIHGAAETAAQTHAVLRARSGFDINQLVAEYRALRASVLNRWMHAVPAEQIVVDDMIRFNEAIDQAVAESVGHFHGQVERARDLLLGMLGHDMRSPLNTIVLTATHLAHINAGPEVSNAAARLIRSGASMRALLDDLVDFNRTRLGLGIKVRPTEVNLAQVLSDELEQLRGAHPQRRFEVTMPAELHGRWDADRMQQVLRNLLLNAVHHGSSTEPIRLALREEGACAVIDVVNGGEPIDAAELAALFEPLRRGSDDDDQPPSDSGLGLGLFIVREIARAHGGDVTARCDGRHTTFTVRLPRA